MGSRTISLRSPGLESQWKYLMRKSARNPMNLKKIRLHLNCLRKIHICVFTVLNFWPFSKEIKNSLPASLSVSLRFFRFDYIWTPQNAIFPKKRVWVFRGDIWGWRRVGSVDDVLGSFRKNGRWQSLGSIFKWSRSKPEALKSLINSPT